MKNLNISEEISKTFDGLSFNWPYFVFSLLTLGVVVLMITLLVYKPLKKMLKKRKEFIQNNIDESIKAKEDALKIREEIDGKIIQATNHATEILNNARSESEKIVTIGANEANKKAELILEQANVMIAKRNEEFEKEQRKIIMESAVEIAKKILKREIKDKDNLKMIDEVLNK
ncbi:ATP synthase B chain [Metamycoplasma cloacale]|uniref:ATP synthase subunit b n=1 Tax=Metamycoplasma cloacale TaxID=92401 RepID=A0A2Z4LMN2_9BACT|nr:ATP synthase F0 subunit B [Metamycoplasma cloacale]AWX42688.1 hypothetical protein DK849_01185 [Metamycoplasma cloacale]VEU79500.1 ATP synthase B chain [Metamycoplasma cloacale]